MQFCDPNEEERLGFHRNCEDFIHTFVMRGERSALANLMAKGLVVSKEEDGRERKEVMESSVDVVSKKKDELVRAVESVEVGRAPNGIVPSTLPHELRSDPTRIEQDDISKLYDVPGGVRCVRDGNLTQAELIALHLRSYRNILEYELLSDVQQLQRRFLRYFASIFVELVDLCYPDRGNTTLEDLLIRDFQVSQHHQLQQRQRDS